MSTTAIKHQRFAIWQLYRTSICLHKQTTLSLVTNKSIIFTFVFDLFLSTELLICSNYVTIYLNLTFTHYPLPTWRNYPPICLSNLILFLSTSSMDSQKICLPLIMSMVHLSVYDHVVTTHRYYLVTFIQPWSYPRPILTILVKGPFAFP